MRAKPISISEPITDLKRVPIIECGEELVDVMSLGAPIVWDRPRFTYRRESYLRRPVAEMLATAASNLPEGYVMGLVEGWRPPHIQRRMYQGVWNFFREKHPDWSETKMRRIVNRYTAPFDSPRVPPPHSTGAAVDLALLKPNGEYHDHSSPFEQYNAAGFAFAAPGLSDEARQTRDILSSVLLPTGLTNYPSEYWHWSFGDQGWAYRGGFPAAIYGPVVPADWIPAEEDLVDEPLKLIGT